MLIIENEIDINSLDQLLLASKEKKITDVFISSSLTYKGFSSTVALLQLIISIRRENNFRLIWDVDGNDVNAVRRFLNNNWGLILSVLNWDNEIVDRNFENIKPLIKEINNETLQAIKDTLNKSVDSNSILLPFFDHLPVDKGLLSIAYINDKLRDENDFFNLTKRVFDITLKDSPDTRKKLKNVDKGLNAILYELFENTHKWARTAYTGKVLRPSIRGILVDFIKLRYEDLTSYANSKGLIKYFNRINMRNPNDFKFTTFLEISIFDSGSGLVQRFCQKNLDEIGLEQEYKELLKCLQKNETSHKDFNESQSRGIGLHRMMDLLSQKNGFLRIRTGRMHLYRDFLSNEFYTSPDNPNYTLIDWDTNSTMMSNRNRVEGTFITLIIPDFTH